MVRRRSVYASSQRLWCRKMYCFMVYNLCCTILGQGNAQAGQVADAMLDAVIEVLTQNPSSSLKTVRLVIFQAPMLKDFCNSMDHRSKKDETDTKGTKGFFESIGSKIKCKNIFLIYAQLWMLNSNVKLILCSFSIFYLCHWPAQRRRRFYHWGPKSKPCMLPHLW